MAKRFIALSFPVRALSNVFRGKFRDGLKALCGANQLAFRGTLRTLKDKSAFEKLLARACAKEWSVYAKKPFAGPQAVFSYLSRYTHRVAIGSNRLLAIDRDLGTITFSYKDYADQSRRKKMTLSLVEFARRFVLHLLPARFVKIRHYGLLANRNRMQKIAAARRELGCANAGSNATRARTSLEPSLPMRCPACGSNNLILIEHRQPLRTVTMPLDSS